MSQSEFVRVPRKWLEALEDFIEWNSEQDADGAEVAGANFAVEAREFLERDEELKPGVQIASDLLWLAEYVDPHKYGQEDRGWIRAQLEALAAGKDVDRA